MDEGDEYVPQMSQLGGDYGASSGMGYPGMISAQSGMPPNPYGDPQMMHPMQQIHQMQPQQTSSSQQVPPAKSKSRSKKKEPVMDPMQSMTAMSHNPMMRSGMGQMSAMEMQQRQQMQMYGGAPPGSSWPGPPQNPYGAPAHPGHPGYAQRQYPAQGYPPQHMQSHMYPGQAQQRPTGYPSGPPSNPYGYPGGGYPPQQGGYPMQQRYPGQPMTSQYPGYPMEQQGYPGYPSAQQQNSAQSDPRMNAASATQGMPPQASQQDPWAAQQQQQQQQQQQHSYLAQQGAPNPQAIQMELQQCQQRIQHLYQQPRTQLIEQDIMQYERRIGYLQSQLAASQQPAGTPTYPQTQTGLPNQAHPHMGQQGQHGTQGTSAAGLGHVDPSVLIQQHGTNQQQNTPVSVTQSGSQVQVNIKPEVPGRTLISVYHQYGEGAPEGSFNENAGKDSVPPEPTPSLQQPTIDKNASQNQQTPQPQHNTAPSTHQQQQQKNSLLQSSLSSHSMYNGSVPPMIQNSLSNGQSNSMTSHIQSITSQPTTLPPQSLPIQQALPPQAQQQVPPSEAPFEEIKRDCVKTEAHAAPSHTSEQQSKSLYENNRDLSATPPMRVEGNICDGIYRDEPVNEQLVVSEMSIMSDETQPALEKTDSYIGRDEEEGEQKVEPMEPTSSQSQKMPIVPTVPLEQHTSVKEEFGIQSELSMQKIYTEELDYEPCESEPKSSPLKEEDSVQNEESPEKEESVESEERDEKEATEEPERSEATLDSASRADSISASVDFEPCEDTLASNDILVPPPLKKTKFRPGPKAKKKKLDEDFSGGEDDDDFMFDRKTSKSRPRKLVKKKVVPTFADDSFEEIPPEFLLENEKRRSGRSTGTRAPKSYREPRADEFDELMVAPTPSTATNEDDSIEDTEMREFVEQQIVEKFLNIRGEGESEELLVKWKGKSYLHVQWKTQAQLEEIDKRVAAKIKRFKQKRAMAFELEDEDFNSDFTIVDRVVDISESDDGTYALIKWRSLSYDEVTWESIDVVPKEKVELWRSRQIIDKKKVKEKPRPSPSEWKKISDETEWKDGNRLREYQFEGVNWLLYCYYGRQNCILADEMGLGKTVQTITFLSQIYEYGIHGPFLIVVPLSTVQNWIREFETWTDMNAIVYHGSGTARSIIQQNEIYYSKQDQENKLWRKNLVKLDALITTFEMVVTDCEFLKKINWKVCVIDEAHRLKNRNCKLLTGGLLSFKMEHRVLLTGTPLQNNIEELFNLLNFLHPEKFPSSASFLEQFGQCQTDQQVQELQEMLKPMMLRRLKEDVEKSLQPREEVIIEVQLSDTQKKYYRAILERNFSHLCKGANAPALMNVMMELRKCCNHPFLIQGAEEQIISESKLLHPEWDDERAQKKLLVEASGKMVLIEKLLPKLRADGHRVLIFSQMVKVLDLIEEFLMNMNYTFERIDGNVRGDLRQAAIDRYSKKDSDRFVFLLCTRAGGLGINLTAADTVIIFDSDWNPQNDLQAQARCHRIGQKKMVKVYRLITANTYEREMFDKASLKLGLDKAVLQSTTALEKTSTSLSRKEVEELLKKGAYGTLMDESNEGSKFSEEDIETILQRRTQTITLEAGAKGSTFSKAAFGSSNNTDSIDINDPNFWNKWAEKANVDMEKAKEQAAEKHLIIQEPRQRKKRFEENELSKQGEDSDSGSEEGRGRGGKRIDKKKRRRGADDDEDYVTYRPDELAFNKSNYFKVEKLMGMWGWGRWSLMKEQDDLEVNELDIEHMARTLLLHCIREFRGDDRIKECVWKLIEPRDVKHSKSDHKNKYTSGWAALPEFNPPNFALDSSFQRHVHRHSNKLLVKIEQLNFLEKEIIGVHTFEINAGKKWKEIPLKCPSVAEPLCPKWDADCDKCLLIGVYKHGLDNYDNMKSDNKLCFEEKKIETMPQPAELSARFRRLVSVAQRSAAESSAEKTRWSRREEQEFLKVLSNYGMKDKKGDPSKLDWETFKTFSPLLEKKADDEIQDYLYAVLAACTKFQGGEVGALELKRQISPDLLNAKKATKLMNRLQLLRKIHHLGNVGFDAHTAALKLCSAEAMPSGWSSQHDKELIMVTHQYGIDNISANILSRPIFQKIIRPTEKTLLRRVVEVCTTVETGKWNGTANTETLEDSDDEERRRREQAAASASRRGRKRAPEVSEKEKLKALMQQQMLGGLSGARPEELQLAVALMTQSLMMPQLNAASASLLSSLFQMPSTSAMSVPSFASTLAEQVQAAENALNLSASTNKSTKSKESSLSTTAASTSSASSAVTAASLAAQQQGAAAMMSGMNLNELFALASLPPETRIPVMNTVTKERLLGDLAPRVRNLGQWLAEHPQYQMDLASFGKTAPEKPSTPSRTSKISTPRPSATPTPSTPKPSSTPREQTPKPTTSSPRLEPGEIPKSKTLSTAASATTVPSLSDSPIAVFSRTTGNLLPVAKWPLLSNISSWLDKNPEANVHSSSVSLVSAFIGKSHADRLGGDGVITVTPSATPVTPVRSAAPTPSASATPSAVASTSASTTSTAATATALAAIAGSVGSSVTTSSATSAAAANQKQTLEALQMQMLLQQSMLQQSLMASYPFMTAGSKPEDIMNNPALLMSMMGMSMPGMGNPGAMSNLGGMGGLASLAMLDPTTLAALTQAPSTASTSSKKKKE